MVVIADTSPLNYLILIDAVHVLPEPLLVPSVVCQRSSENVVFQSIFRTGIDSAKKAREVPKDSDKDGNYFCTLIKGRARIRVVPANITCFGLRITRG